MFGDVLVQSLRSNLEESLGWFSPAVGLNRDASARQDMLGRSGKAVRHHDVVKCHQPVVRFFSDLGWQRHVADLFAKFRRNNGQPTTEAVTAGVHGLGQHLETGLEELELAAGSCFHLSR